MAEEERAHVVKAQIAFRQARRASLASRASRRRTSLVLEEDESDAAFDDEAKRRLNFAAVVVMQSWALLLRSRATSGIAPYERASFAPAGAAERSARIFTLQRRFPRVPTPAIAAALDRCRGHAGCAVDQLQRESGCVPLDLS